MGGATSRLAGRNARCLRRYGIAADSRMWRPWIIWPALDYPALDYPALDYVGHSISNGNAASEPKTGPERSVT
jgi:hypothetical protein